MSRWRLSKIGEFVDFNPTEKMANGKVAKKIPMAELTEFERKIKGFELAPYKGGPKFRNGDTLVAKITPCLENGKTARVDILEENEVGFGSSEFIVLRENQNSISDYVYYLAISPIFRARAISCMDGTSGRKRVNEKALKRQQIKVPDRPIQRKIAAVLSAFDDKIELNKKISADLEALAKTLYNYWFIQFDFPDKDGRPYKSSGGIMEYCELLKKEVPKGWVPGTIQDLGEIITGGTPSTRVGDYFATKGIPWITPKDLSGSSKKFIRRGAKDISQLGLQNSAAKVIPMNSVLMTARAPIGYLAISSNEVTTNQGFKSIVPHTNFGPEYVYQTLKALVPLFQVLGAKSTFREISKDVLAMVPILLPDEAVLKEYNESVLDLIEKIRCSEDENTQLAELRDWLLPMLMNGQVSVDEAYEQVEEALNVAAEVESSYQQ